MLRAQNTDAELSVELKLEDEICKCATVKMAAKLVSADIVTTGKGTVKVGPSSAAEQYSYCTVFLHLGKVNCLSFNVRFQHLPSLLP